MVNIRQSHDYEHAVPEDLEPWLQRIKENNPGLDQHCDEALIAAVASVREAEIAFAASPQADAFTSTRISSLRVGLEMAEILSELDRKSVV